MKNVYGFNPGEYKVWIHNGEISYFFEIDYFYTEQQQELFSLIKEKYDIENIDYDYFFLSCLKLMIDKIKSGQDVDEIKNIYAKLKQYEVKNNGKAIHRYLEEETDD